MPLVVVSGGERIGVDAMDNKANIEEYLRSLPLPKVVYLHTAFFFENVATKRGTRRVKVDRDEGCTDVHAFYRNLWLVLYA